MKFLRLVIFILPLFLSGCGEDEPEVGAGNGYIRIVDMSEGVSAKGLDITVDVEPLGGIYKFKIETPGLIRFKDFKTPYNVGVNKMDETTGEVELFFYWSGSLDYHYKFVYEVTGNNNVYGGVIAFNQDAMTEADDEGKGT